MARATKPIPQGLHTLTTHLVVRGAAKAIDFYKRAFGAEEIMRMEGPGGKIGHAELRIGDSVIFLADEFPQSTSKAPQTLGGTTCTLNLYVEDVDASFEKAVTAGAKTTMPLADILVDFPQGDTQEPNRLLFFVGSNRFFSARHAGTGKLMFPFDLSRAKKLASKLWNRYEEISI